MATDDDGVYMLPIPRIKKVPNIFRPNTHRVLHPLVNDELAPTSDSKLTAYPRPTVCTHNILGQPLSDAQKPTGAQVKSSKYAEHLMCNTRTMMEPICDIGTAGIANNGPRWWQHLEHKCPPSQPQYTFDTMVRRDFLYRPEAGPINTRFSATPKKPPAIGIAPVNFLRDPDGKQRFWKEEFSFDHQYDSRRNPPLKPKGRRQGNFVWSRYEPADVDELVAPYDNPPPCPDVITPCKPAPPECPQDWCAAAVSARGPAYRPPPVAGTDCLRSRTTTANYGAVPVAL